MSFKQSVPSLVFKGYGIVLRPVMPQDLARLRRWRNSPRIIKQMLDTSYITPHQQRLWYEKIRGRVDQAHWVVWCKGIRTGYVNIKGEGPLESQTEISGGFYVGDSKVRHGLLGYAIGMIYHEIIFEYFSISEIRDSVLKSNYPARRFNKQMGYREQGENGNYINIFFNRSSYNIAKQKFARYFDDAHCELIG
jgi:RimJ/RimL family protein N-acetyltransferase